MLPYLICTWFCIVCGTVPLDYRKCLKLSEPYISHSFPMCGLPHISFNFPVEQFHLIFYDFQTMNFHFFWNYQPLCFLLFHTLPLFYLDCHTFLALFVSGTDPVFFVWMSRMCVSIFFVWMLQMSHKYLCVSITSKWTLLFVSFWVITDPFSFLPCVDCTSYFLNEKSTCPTSFLSFGITNLFIATFTISNVIIYFYFLVFFFLFWRFI